MQLDPLTWTILTTVFTGGAVIGGVKIGLNGTKERTKEIQRELREHVKQEDQMQMDMLTRLARVETTQLMILDKLKDG